jgi:hypothetical protein
MIGLLIAISLTTIAAAPLSLTTIAAAPLPVQESATKTRLSRFIVENTSDQPVTIYMYEAEVLKEEGIESYVRLNNGQTYYLRVDANETKQFTVKRAFYAYDLIACGSRSVSSGIDLTERNEIIVPKCVVYSPNELPEPRVDGITQRPSLVRFSITNYTDTYAYISMQGPENYYLTVPNASTKEFTVEIGTYTYAYLACDLSSEKSTFTAHFNKNLALTCPNSAE